MTTAQGTQSVKLSQTFQFPVAQVYQAWVQPEALQQWFGRCEGVEIQKVEMDVQVGGKWRILSSSPDGHLKTVNGEYREVVPNQKVAFTWNIDTDKIKVQNTLVTVQFRELGNETEITLTHERFPDAEVAQPHAQGWNMCFVNLEKYLGKSA
jgi:uncharacterized protein YndB with AHSA1/START domain